MTTRRFLLQLQQTDHPSREPHRIMNILSLNAMLVALLTTASAVNGIIFYSYL